MAGCTIGRWGETMRQFVRRFGKIVPHQEGRQFAHADLKILQVLAEVHHLAQEFDLEVCGQRGYRTKMVWLGLSLSARSATRSPFADKPSSDVLPEITTYPSAFTSVTMPT